MTGSSSESEDTVPDATLELASELVGHLVSSLPTEIDILALGRSKLPFKVLTLRETLLYRMAELAAGAVDLFATEKSIAGIILTRSALETTAMLFAVKSLVEDSLEKRSVSQIDDTLMKLLFGGRSEMATLKAINVLTHIDKMDREFEGLRWWYEQLSDIAHPNYPGLVGGYADINREEFIVSLGPRASFGSSLSTGIAALCSCIGIFVHVYNQMKLPLEKFQALCNDSLAETADSDESSERTPRL